MNYILMCKIFIKEGRVILEKIEWRIAMKDRLKTVLAVTLIVCAVSFVFYNAKSSADAASADEEVTEISEFDLVGGN